MARANPGYGSRPKPPAWYGQGEVPCSQSSSLSYASLCPSKYSSSSVTTPIGGSGILQSDLIDIKGVAMRISVTGVEPRVTLNGEEQLSARLSPTERAGIRLEGRHSRDSGLRSAGFTVSSPLLERANNSPLDPAVAGGDP